MTLKENLKKLRNSISDDDKSPESLLALALLKVVKASSDIIVGERNYCLDTTKIVRIELALNELNIVLEKIYEVFESIN